jgi:hypothetical protein
MAREQIRQCQIVAIVVGRRFALLRLFKKRDSFRKFSLLDVDFAQIVIGVVASGLELHGVLELLLRSLHVSRANQTGSEVRTGRGGRRLEVHGLLKVLFRKLVLRLPGVDHSQEFVSFEAVGNLLQKPLQLCCRFRQMTRVILRHSGLELAIKFLVSMRRSGMVLSETPSGHEGVPKENCRSCVQQATSTSHDALNGSTTRRPLQQALHAQQSEGAPDRSAFNVDQNDS